MSRKYLITFGSRADVRKGFPTQYLIGILSKFDGISAGITRDKEKAQPFKKKPTVICNFLNAWHMCKYPTSQKKFRPHKIS